LTPFDQTTTPDKESKSASSLSNFEAPKRPDLSDLDEFKGLGNCSSIISEGPDLKSF
jgi:hypothetical protein